MFQYCLFDLDGTLTDSQEGIIKSVQYALSFFGIEEPDLQKLTPFWDLLCRKALWSFMDLARRMQQKQLHYTGKGLRL